MLKGLTALAGAIALAVVVPTLASAARAGGLRHAPIHKLTNSSSTNWSGYAATGSRFTSVSASWTQPTAVCSFGTSYSSFWVGLDGDTSNTVEQTGSSADCSSANVPSYYAWYEMYPKFPSNLSNPVGPGDAFTASVTTDDVGRFTLTISDTSAPWTFTTTQRLHSAALASAEVIAEAPSSRSGVLPLTNFGTVSFSGATANGASLSTFNPDPITMVSGSGAGSTVKAQPSGISGSGSFSVTWKNS